MQTRFSKIESVLIADCGRNTTRVALVEVVDQAYRFVARGEVPSTLEEPFPDVTIGVLNAIRAIEDTTGKPASVRHAPDYAPARRRQWGGCFCRQQQRCRTAAGGRGGSG